MQPRGTIGLCQPVATVIEYRGATLSTLARVEVCVRFSQCHATSYWHFCSCIGPSAQPPRRHEYNRFSFTGHPEQQLRPLLLCRMYVYGDTAFSSPATALGLELGTPDGSGALHWVLPE